MSVMYLKVGHAINREGTYCGMVRHNSGYYVPSSLFPCMICNKLCIIENNSSSHQCQPRCTVRNFNCSHAADLGAPYGSPLN